MTGKSRNALIFLAACLLIGVGGYYFFDAVKKYAASVTFLSRLAKSKEPRSHRILVFVHGSFGTTLGLLDLPSVVRDTMSSSGYARKVREMRKDPYFFKTQPILERGLVKVEPTFNLDEIGRRGAYPIAGAFQEMAEYAEPGVAENHYYMFGWSGLMSQRKRRLESIRLYNAISQEVEKFRAVDIEPKVYIYAHSHGGNVVLNMGALHSIISGEALPDVGEKTANEGVAFLGQVISALPNRDEAEKLEGQKILDYKPEKPLSALEMVVMMGMPVQPETDSYVMSPLFNKVYHLYSTADVVQVSDWATTCRYYSDQRFDRLRELCDTNKLRFPSNLTQMRITLEKNHNAESGKSVLPAEKKEESSWWRYLVGSTASSEKVIDPTHKEFWFVVSRDEGHEINPFKPLPIVVYLPLILSGMQDYEELTDVEVAAGIKDEDLVFSYYRRGGKEMVTTSQVPLGFIHQIQDAVYEHRLDKSSIAEELSIIGKYVRL